MNRANLYDHARGEFLAFVDGDDYVLGEDRFARQIALLEDHPECSLCAGNTALYEEGDPPRFVRFEHEASDDLVTGAVMGSEEYLRVGHFHNSSMLMRRPAFNMFAEFRRELFVDFPLTLFLLQFGDLVYLDAPVLAHTHDGRGIWAGLTPFQRDIRSVCFMADWLRYLPRFRNHHLSVLERRLERLHDYGGDRTLDEESARLLAHYSPRVRQAVVLRKGVWAVIFRLLLILKRLLSRLTGKRVRLLYHLFLDARTYGFRL